MTKREVERAQRERDRERALRVVNCQPHAGHGVPCSVPSPLPLPLASSLCALHFSSSIFVLKPPSHSLARCVPAICQKLIKLKIPSWKENTPKKLPGPKIIYLFYDLNFSNSFRWNFSFINFAPSHLQRIHRTPLALQTTTAISVLLTKAKMRHANCTRCRHIKNAKSVCGTVCVCGVCYCVVFHHRLHRLVQLLVNLAKVSNAHMTFSLTGYATRPHCAGRGVWSHQTQTF